jgi:hypothetical protein
MKQDEKILDTVVLTDDDARNTDSPVMPNRPTAMSTRMRKIIITLNCALLLIMCLSMLSLLGEQINIVIKAYGNSSHIFLNNGFELLAIATTILFVAYSVWTMFVHKRLEKMSTFFQSVILITSIYAGLLGYVFWDAQQFFKMFTDSPEIKTLRIAK